MDAAAVREVVAVVVRWDTPIGVARWITGPEAPENLQAFAFFLLTASPTSPEAYAAWYAAPDRPNRDVDMVRGALLAAAKTQRPKSLAHYILLPPGTSAAEGAGSFSP